MIVVVAVASMLGGTLLWPFATSLFRFGPLHLNDLAVALTAGPAVLACLALLKPFWRERLRAEPASSMSRSTTGRWLEKSWLSTKVGT